jgi:hypothetical protein
MRYPQKLRCFQTLAVQDAERQPPGKENFGRDIGRVPARCVTEQRGHPLGTLLRCAITSMVPAAQTQIEKGRSSMHDPSRVIVTHPPASV